MGPGHIAQREEGQGLVEFALIVPILMVLILGMIDLGKALGYKNDETNFANQAARLAVVSQGTTCQPCTGGGIADYITNTLAPPEFRSPFSGSIASPGLSVTFTFPNMNGQPGSPCPDSPTVTACGYCTGDPVTVNVTSTYRFLNFLVGKSAIFGSHPISSSATMRMETAYDTQAASHANGFTPTNPNMNNLAKPCT